MGDEGATQIKSLNFDAFDPICIIVFLSAFNLSCNINHTHDEATFSLFDLFMRGSIAALSTTVS